MTTTSIALQGHCSSKFALLRDTFADNFVEAREIGARITLIVAGETVADLWAGWADPARTRPWTQDTIVAIWSSTKGIVGTCFAMIVDRGLASYEDKVCQYWPEFAAAGKEAITIGMLLAHQAGLSGFMEPAGIGDLLSSASGAARLAAQAPQWTPGTASGYHGMTLGLLATELLGHELLDRTPLRARPIDRSCTCRCQTGGRDAADRFRHVRPRQRKEPDTVFGLQQSGHTRDAVQRPALVCRRSPVCKRVCSCACLGQHV